MNGSARPRLVSEGAGGARVPCYRQDTEATEYPCVSFPGFHAYRQCFLPCISGRPDSRADKCVSTFHRRVQHPEVESGERLVLLLSVMIISKILPLRLCSCCTRSLKAPSTVFLLSTVTVPIRSDLRRGHETTLHMHEEAFPISDLGDLQEGVQ